MAWTEKYVTTTGTEAWATNSSSNPSSITEAAANCAAGERINVKSGTYTLTAALTQTTYGTANNMIWWRGYNSTPGDLDTPSFNSDASLDTTNLPDINTQGNQFSPGDHTLFSSLSIRGARGGPIFGSTNRDYITIYGCKFENTLDDSNAKCIDADNDWRLLWSDVILSGANSFYCFDGDNNNNFYGCRILNQSTTTGTGCISVQSPQSHVINTVFAGDGIGCNFFANGNPVRVIGCSFHGLDTALQFPNAVQTAHGLLVDNVGYGLSKWIDCLYVATANYSFVEINNKLSATTPRTGVGDGMLLEETTLTADPFTDSANWDFTLNDTAGGGAVARAAGLRDFRDLGAFQSECTGGGGGIAQLAGIGGGLVTPATR